MDASTTADGSTGKAGKAAKTTEGKRAGAGAAPAPREAFHIAPDKLSLSEQVRNSWTGVVPAGTRPEDLDLRIEPWALVADLLHEGDDIRLIAADKRRIFDCVCVHRAGTRAICRVTLVVDVPQFSEIDWNRIPDGYEVVRAAPDDVQPGWLVRRKATDGSEAVLLNYGSHFYEREQAVRFLLDHATVRGDTPQSVYRPVYA